MIPIKRRLSLFGAIPLPARQQGKYFIRREGNSNSRFEYDNGEKIPDSQSNLFVVRRFLFGKPSGNWEH
jgi:hypothetical protein